MIMEKKDEEVRQEMLELQMIEERLQSLIERYTLEIEDETKNLKKYKGALENVLKESDCLSEVAYPATWTVEYLTKAKSGTNTNSDERKD